MCVRSFYLEAYTGCRWQCNRAFILKARLREKKAIFFYYYLLKGNEGNQLNIFLFFCSSQEMGFIYLLEISIFLKKIMSLQFKPGPTLKRGEREHVPRVPEQKADGGAK